MGTLYNKTQEERKQTDLKSLDFSNILLLF